MRVHTLTLVLASLVVGAAGCAHVSHRPPVDPSVVIISPVGDTAISIVLPARGAYSCRRWLLYDTDGPMSRGCVQQIADTTWIAYQDTAGYHILAASRETLVPLDSLEPMAARLEAAITQRYGVPDTCASNSGTLSHWRWWRADPFTIQERVVDPSRVIAVRRGRVEVQAIPASATPCLTWVHAPLPQPPNKP